MKHNKNSATEDQVGLIHNAVTKIWQKKLDLIEQEVDKLLDGGDEESVMSALFMMDERTLNGAGKWATTMNEVSFALPEDQKGSKLNDSLERIKKKQRGKVISFTDEALNG